MCPPKVPKPKAEAVAADKKPQVLTNEYFAGGPAVMGGRIGRNALRIDRGSPARSSSPATPSPSTNPNTPPGAFTPALPTAAGLTWPSADSRTIRNEFLRGIAIP
jgi:hypothetical protein